MNIAICFDCPWSKKSPDYHTVRSMAWDHKTRQTKGHRTFVAESEDVFREALEEAECVSLVPKDQIVPKIKRKQIHRKHPSGEATICDIPLNLTSKVLEPWTFAVGCFCRTCHDLPTLLRAQEL